MMCVYIYIYYGFYRYRDLPSNHYQLYKFYNAIVLPIRDFKNL